MWDGWETLFFVSPHPLQLPPIARRRGGSGQDAHHGALTSVVGSRVLASQGYCRGCGSHRGSPDGLDSLHGADAGDPCARQWRYCQGSLAQAQIP